MKRNTDTNQSTLVNEDILDAIKSHDKEKIKSLLKNVQDINYVYKESGATLLFQAIFSKDLDAVELLVKHGADVNVEDNFGHTPLFDAVQYKDMDITKFLLTHGAKIDFSSLRDDLIALALCNNKNITQLLISAEEIDEHLEKGEFDNITSYDQDLFAGRYACYLAKNEVKKDSEESKKIFDGIFSNIQSAAFDLTPLTLINLIVQKCNGSFNNLGDKEVIDKVIQFYNDSGYDFNYDVTKFLNGEITLTDTQIDNLNNQIFKANLAIIKSNLTDLLENGYAVMLEPLLKLSLPQSFKISLIKAYVEYNIANDQENILDINYNDQDNLVVEAIGNISEDDADLI
ncbi:MAG: ankyrin repeat domain-containing protein [Rickettsiales bacterium]|nr:MAG: ankyrin repeat domain-containing protein [Rickettsiales bacterium]